MKIKEFIFTKFQPKTAEVWGMSFALDQVYGFPDPAKYKKPVADLLQREIKPGGVIVDVGANIGLFSCLMAKIVGEKGKVYAFEPEPENLKLLRENIAENDLKNILIFEEGLSDKPEEFGIAPRGAHSSFNIISKDLSDKVKLVRLDDILKDKDNVSLIKMDIVGYELKALGGMPETLSRSKNAVIVSAFCPAYLERAGDSGEKYLEKLSEAGFNIFEITGTGLTEIAPDKFSEFTLKYRSKGTAQAEIFCVRTNKL